MVAFANAPRITTETSVVPVARLDLETTTFQNGRLIDSKVATLATIYGTATKQKIETESVSLADTSFKNSAAISRFKDNQIQANMPSLERGETLNINNRKGAPLARIQPIRESSSFSTAQKEAPFSQFLTAAALTELPKAAFGISLRALTDALIENPKAKAEREKREREEATKAKLELEQATAAIKLDASRIETKTQTRTTNSNKTESFANIAAEAQSLSAASDIRSIQAALASARALEAKIDIKSTNENSADKKDAKENTIKTEIAIIGSIKTEEKVEKTPNTLQTAADAIFKGLIIEALHSTTPSTEANKTLAVLENNPIWADFINEAIATRDANKNEFATKEPKRDKNELSGLTFAFNRGDALKETEAQAIAA
jgi:hypothetical protein